METRERIDWPIDVPIPQNVEEGLAQGWELDGNLVEDTSPDRKVETGYFEMVKNFPDSRGIRELCLEVPFRAVFEYGRPRPSKAALVKTA